MHNGRVSGGRPRRRPETEEERLNGTTRRGRRPGAEPVAAGVWLINVAQTLLQLAKYANTKRRRQECRHHLAAVHCEAALISQRAGG